MSDTHVTKMLAISVLFDLSHHDPVALYCICAVLLKGMYKLKWI